MESIIQKEKECIVCHTKKNLHRHHVYFGQLRSISDKYGLTVWLCGTHHNLSNQGVHFDKALDLEIKIIGQKAFEREHSRDEFKKLIGRSYL